MTPATVPVTSTCMCVHDLVGILKSRSKPKPKVSVEHRQDAKEEQGEDAACVNFGYPILRKFCARWGDYCIAGQFIRGRGGAGWTDVFVTVCFKDLNMCECFACMYVSIHACLVPAEAGKWC